MRTLFIHALFLIYAFGLYGQKSHSITSAIGYALEHNYDYKKAQLDKMITYEKTQEVLTQGFPKVTGVLGYQNQYIVPTSVIPGDFFGKPGQNVPVQFGVSNSMNAAVNLQQLIFDGRYLVGLQARSAVKSLANLQVKMSERDVKVLISKSYYQALMASRSLKSLRESKEVLDKLYQHTQKTYQQGLIEELDVERMQYNVRTLDNTIDMLETQSVLALSALKLNMGYPMDDTLILTENLTNDLAAILHQKLIEDSIENRIEMKLVEQGITLKKYDLKQLRYSAMPSLYGSFTYGYNSFSQQFNFFNNPWYNYGNFGVQLQVPVFDGLTRKSQVSQMRLAVQKLETDKAQVFQALKLETMNSILNLKNNINEYQNQKDILNLSEKIERKTRLKYTEGVGSSFEFANAQNDRIQQYLKLLQTELKLLNSNIDYKKSSGKI